MIIYTSFLLLICTILPAQVEWANKDLSFTPQITESELSGEFPFTITGDQPVVITGVVASCGGCTVPKLLKSSYLPGENGVISFIFDLTGREGAQEKSIRVTFADDIPPVNLRFSVSMPYVFQASPRITSWKKGSSPVAQTIKLTSGIEGVQISDIIYDESKMTVTAADEKAGRFDLSITPKSTDFALREKIVVKSSLIVGGKARETSLFMIVTE